MMDNKNLKENIRTFSLDKGPRGSQGYERVLLVPFGLTGHGLSSFINSCMYTLHDGEFTEHAEVANTLGGVTMKRNAFPLSDHITIVDNRGFPSMKKVYQAEVYAQLGNFIPIGREVHWKYNFRAMMEEIEESELETNNTDFIVPIFVYSCRCLISSCEMDEIRKCMENCTQMTGLTKHNNKVLSAEAKGPHVKYQKATCLVPRTKSSPIDQLKHGACSGMTRDNQRLWKDGGYSCVSVTDNSWV